MVFACVPYVAVYATHLGVDKSFLALFVKYLKQLLQGNPLMPPPPTPPSSGSSSSPSTPSSIPSPPSPPPLVLLPRRESQPELLSESGSAAVYNKPLKSVLFHNKINPHSRRIILALSGERSGSGEGNSETTTSTEAPVSSPSSSLDTTSPHNYSSPSASSTAAMTGDLHVSSPPEQLQQQGNEEKEEEEQVDGLQIARRQFKYTMAHGNMSPHTFNSFTKYFVTALPSVFWPGSDGGNDVNREIKSQPDDS
jgi:hypothetical protein